MSASPPRQLGKSNLLPILLSTAGGATLALFSCSAFLGYAEPDIGRSAYLFAAGFAFGTGLLIVGLQDAGKYLRRKRKED